MRLLHLAGFLAAASLAVSGCKCGGSSGDDAGTDGGGKDAGPISCQTTADCKTAGATDLVCDPQEKVCVAKCAQDSDCTYVASGVCETNEGTCHKPCGEEDFCPAVVPADGGVSLVCREQTGHCVPRCSQDDDCSAIASGSRCVETTGKCVGDAHGCNFDTDCNSYTDFDDYCFNGGIQCRCVIESNDAGTNGVCHRRRRSCSECTSDVQCGNVPQFDPQGACQVVNGDTSGKKYCLFQHSGPCACGYFDNGSGFCAPASGRTCADPGCAEDKDCPGGSVCNAARCACEARCRWDFANKTTAAPGCPIVAGVQTTCWVDNENLDPTSIYYGSGRCKPPCMDDNACKFSASNPHGGDKLKCAGEQLAGGGLSDKRCRANGDCMDDLECPVQPDTSIYFGYCDRGSFACKLDCRVGTDPLSSKPYNDCRSPYGCQNGPNDAGICVLKTCVEQGGASIACNTGEYCCGEDKNGDDAGDPCPPPGERDPSGCYKAPKPPFCTSCMSNDDCKSLQAPSWQTNCPPGVVSPSCSPYPILCYPFQDQATMRQVNVCAPATYNDSRRDSFGRGRDTKGCPAGFSAFYQRIKFVNGDDNCTSDAQCQLGGIDAGHCGIDNTVTLRDGGHPMSCLCTVGSATEQCPNQPDAGVTSFCKFGNNGDTQACMQTVSCLPPSPYVFSDAGPPFNGCAL